MIGDAIFELLSTDATVIGLVPASDIFPVRTKQTTQNPVIVYNLRTVPEKQKSGVSIVKVIDVQLDTYASTYSLCYQIANACIGVLDGFKGNAANFEIQRITLDDVDDRFDDIAESFRVTIDFEMRWLDQTDSFLLLQNGDFLLLQTNDRLILNG